VSLGRRRFLALLGGGGAAAAAAGALPGCAPSDEPAPSVSVPAPDATGVIAFRLSDVPALDRPGGAVIANAPGLDPILVVRTPSGGVAALSATCTHLGCPLGYQAPEVVCPCHQSRFALDGLVLKPPATAPLQTFDAALDAASGTVTVGTPAFPAVVAGALTLPFRRFPALAAPGGSATGRPGGSGPLLLVMALAGGGYRAVTARCPHQGCTVGYAAAAGEVRCPCHGSAFGTDGALLVGPATVGLTPYPATADGLGVTVTGLA